MRWMGLDIGEKRIGIAISDPLAITAQGFDVYHRVGSFVKDLEYLAKVVAERQVDGVLLGLPKNMNGTEGPMAEKIRKFGTELAGKITVPILYWDERLSTGSAQKVLIEADMSRAKRRNTVDKVAAVIILQNFLDSKIRMNFEQTGKIPE